MVKTALLCGSFLHRTCLGVLTRFMVCTGRNVIVRNVTHFCATVLRSVDSLGMFYASESILKNLCAYTVTQKMKTGTVLACTTSHTPTPAILQMQYMPS